MQSDFVAQQCSPTRCKNKVKDTLSTRGNLITCRVSPNFL